MFCSQDNEQGHAALRTLEYLTEQVLLIKTCWGGRSVKKDFLPPSEEMPSDDLLGEELDRRRKRSPDSTMAEVKGAYGKAYRDMIAHVKEVQANLKNYFPKYDGK